MYLELLDWGRAKLKAYQHFWIDFLKNTTSMMNCKRFVALPVFAVFSLMGFVYYVTIFVFIEDWVSLRSSPGTLNAAIFTILAFMFLFSFFVCVLTDPGHVPSSYVPDVEGRQIPGQEAPEDVSFTHAHFFFLPSLILF